MDNSFEIERFIDSHEQTDTTEIVEIIPGHEDRKEASQSTFDRAKKFLTKVYGGKRCILCERRGENFAATEGNQIESHHVFEWCHWNDNDMQMVEIALRTLSPFLHGMYMISEEEILAGKPIPSLWDHPELKGKPFTSLDDPRNQYFLCHAHHQQSTSKQIEGGYDIVGLHHAPWPQWLQYFGMKTPKLPMKHISTDGFQIKVLEEDIHILDNKVE